MRGHEKYIDLLKIVHVGAERGEAGYGALLEMLQDTAIFDAGLERDLMPIPDSVTLREKLMSEAGRRGLTAIRIPRWAIIVRDAFIVHMERREVDGYAGCLARLIMLNGKCFVFCPTAIFITDDWRQYKALAWEMTDGEPPDDTEIAGYVVQCVLRGVMRLGSLPVAEVAGRRGRFVPAQGGAA